MAPGTSGNHYLRECLRNLAGKWSLGCIEKIVSYIDDYPTCENTYATLRIYTGEVAPGFVTRILDVEPTETLTKSTVAKGSKEPAILNGWFLSSKDKVESLDSRRHIDWLLQHFLGKEDELKKVI